MRAIIVAVAACLPSLFAAEMLTEEFAADGPIANYVGAGEVFSAVTSTGAPTAQALGGELNLALIGGTAGTLYTHIDLGATQTLLSMQFDYKGNAYGSASTAFGLYAGAFDAIGDFNPGWNPNQGARNWAKVTVGGANPYPVNAQDGTNTTYTLAGNLLDTSYTWSLYLNETGSTQEFLGPDYAPYSLDTASWTLFVGTDLVAGNVPKGTYGANGSIDGIIFHLNRNYDGGTSNQSIDNILIRDDLDLYTIPEPASLALLALTAGALVLRRGRSSRSSARKGISVAVVVCCAFVMSGTTQAAMQVISPTATGIVRGYEVNGAFDAQPTLLSYNAAMDYYEPQDGGRGETVPRYVGDRSAYFDFGEDWEKYQVYELWISYGHYASAGNIEPNCYPRIWWDDDTDERGPDGIPRLSDGTPDPTAVTSTLLFPAHDNVVSQGEQEHWVLDQDFGNTPYMLQGRYLVVGSTDRSISWHDTTMSEGSRIFEFAMVGSVIPEPASLTLFLASLLVCLRRRRCVRAVAPFVALVLVLGGLALAPSAPAAPIFAQDFADGGVPADYIAPAGSASGSLFTDLSATGSGTVSVVSNEAQIAMPVGAGSEGGFGVADIGDGGEMVFSMDFSYSSSGTPFGPTGSLTLGEYDGGFDTYPHNASKFVQINLRQLGGSGVQLEAAGQPVQAVSYDDTHSLTVYLNNTDETKRYIGPDGGTYTLNVSAEVDGSSTPYMAGSYAAWIDGALWFNDAVASNYIHNGNWNDRTLDTVMLNLGSHDSVTRTMTFDNFLVEDTLPIPEPGTAIVTALGALMVLRRRR